MITPAAFLTGAMPAAIYDAGESGLYVFLLMTVLLGGAASYATGKAIAETWRPFWQLPLYVLLIAVAVRFLHFSVFEGSLLSLRSLITDGVALSVLGLLGHRRTRRRQMRDQYGWRGAST